MFLICGKDFFLIKKEINKITKNDFKSFFLVDFIDLKNEYYFYNILVDTKQWWVFYDYLFDKKNKKNLLLAFLQNIPKTIQNLILVIQDSTLIKVLMPFFLKCKKISSFGVKKSRLFLEKKFIEHQINLPNKDEIIEAIISNGLYDSYHLEQEFLKIKYLTQENKIAWNWINCLYFNIDHDIFSLIEDFFYKKLDRIVEKLSYYDNLNFDYRYFFNVFISHLFWLKVSKLCFLKNQEDFDKTKIELGFSHFTWFKNKLLISKLKIEEINAFVKNLIELEYECVLGKKNLKESLKLILLTNQNTWIT